MLNCSQMRAEVIKAQDERNHLISVLNDPAFAPFIGDILRRAMESRCETLNTRADTLAEVLGTTSIDIWSEEHPWN